jgi:hypothetical protein
MDNPFLFELLDGTELRKGGGLQVRVEITPILRVIGLLSSLGFLTRISVSTFYTSDHSLDILLVKTPGIPDLQSRYLPIACQFIDR